eukprot:83437_1
MQMDINLDWKHLYALTEVVIHRGTPHARHFHAYLKDFMKDLFKEGKYQKKEVKTTKSVCIVSHNMAVHRMRMMNECEMSLPTDLVEFVAEKEKKEAARREAKQNKMRDKCKSYHHHVFA